MSVMRSLLLVGLVALVSACNSNLPSFAAMSEVELAAFNRTVPLAEQVYCVEQAGTSTYIRRRICQTYAQWLSQNERDAMRLDVLNSSPGFGLPSTIGDTPQR